MEDELFPRAIACLVTGLILGLPALVGVDLVQRRRGRFGLPVALAVVLAGAVGGLGIFLHCPLVAPAHLLLGHAMVLAVYLGLAVVAVPRRVA